MPRKKRTNEKKAKAYTCATPLWAYALARVQSEEVRQRLCAPACVQEHKLQPRKKKPRRRGVGKQTVHIQEHQLQPRQKKRGKKRGAGGSKQSIFRNKRCHPYKKSGKKRARKKKGEIKRTKERTRLCMCLCVCLYVSVFQRHIQRRIEDT